MSDYGMNVLFDIDPADVRTRVTKPTVPTASPLSSRQPGRRGWPLQRILFLLAGTVTLIGVVLGIAVSSWFLLLPAMAGANQLLMVAVGWCPMSLLLTRIGVRPSCR